MVSTPYNIGNSPKKHEIDYKELAREYCEETTTMYHKGTVYAYTGTHYRREEEFALHGQRWLMRRGIKATTSVLNNFILNVKAMALLDSKQMPCWTNGCTVEVIPFKNGLLDVKSYLNGNPVLLSHSPHYRSSYCLPYDFDPKAQCPLWRDKLPEFFSGDKEQALLLQEWFGYVLSGDTSRQVLALSVGVPGSGKSTVARMLTALVGEQNSVGYHLRSLASRFGYSGLVGMPLAVVGEVELSGSRDRAEILEKLKGVVGEDSVMIEHKYDPVTYTVTLPTRFHVLSNTMPVFKDASAALVRRLLIFRHDTVAPNPDPTLTTRLLGELPGIAIWALDGLRRLHSNGCFSPCSRMKAELKTFRRESSPCLAFLEDCCEVYIGLDTGALCGVALVEEPCWVFTSDLLLKAVNWYRDEGLEFNQSWFMRDLRSLLPALSPPKRKRDGAGKQQYATNGIRLKIDEGL